MPPTAVMANASATSPPQTRRRAQDFIRWEYKKDPIPWRPTTTMNVHDLSNDDDFLSHILVEKIGASAVPLLVHRMDSNRRLPKTDEDQLLTIVRKLVSAKSHRETAIKQAVDDLLSLVPVQYYMRSYDQKQINAFATHASRYFEIYMPAGLIEITHTSRYTHKTGKSELCILATRPLAVGTVVTELKGSMADLTKEEEHKLKHGDPRSAGLGIRRDFSVIHSRQKKMNHLFLGPARFVNHDCKHNVELFRDGRCITFRVIRPIAMGEEITTHYGGSYFGYKNKDCLCATCERRGKGGYSPRTGEEEEEMLFTAVLRDYESDSSIGAGSDDEPEVPVDVNERRTRRGVYHVNKDKGKRREDDEDSDDSESQADASMPRPTPQAEDAVVKVQPSILSVPSISVSMPEAGPSLSPAQIISPPRSMSSLTSTASGSSGGSSLTSVAASISSLSSLASDLTALTASAVSAFSGVTAFLGTNTSSTTTTPRTAASTPPLSKTPSPTTAVAASVATLENIPAVAKDEDASHSDSGSEEDTEILTSRSLRTRKMPPRFYDLTKRRGPRGPRKSHGMSLSLSAIEDEQLAEVTPPPKPPMKPLGDDGDRYPRCKTCTTVIPVIYNNAEKIEWGPKDDDLSGEHECPRCIRHFVIYQVAWPLRVQPRIKHGVSIATTPAGQSTPTDPKIRAKIGAKVTRPLLPVIDRKIAAATTSAKKVESSKSNTVAQAAPDLDPAPPKKRRKLSRAHDSEQATSRSSARARVPSAKIRAADDAPKRKPGRPRKQIDAVPDMRELEAARKRGRPRQRAVTPMPSIGSHSRILAVARAMKAKKEKAARDTVAQNDNTSETSSPKKTGRAERGMTRAQSRDSLEKQTEDLQDDSPVDTASDDEADGHDGAATTSMWMTEAEDDNDAEDNDGDADPSMPELYGTPVRKPRTCSPRVPTPQIAAALLNPSEPSREPTPLMAPPSHELSPPPRKSTSPREPAPPPPTPTPPPRDPTPPLPCDPTPPPRDPTPAPRDPTPPPRSATPPPRSATPPPRNTTPQASQPSDSPLRFATQPAPLVSPPPPARLPSPLSSLASYSTTVPDPGSLAEHQTSLAVHTPPKLNRLPGGMPVTMTCTRPLGPLASAGRAKRTSRMRSPSVELVPSPPRPGSSRDSRLSSLSENEVEIVAGPIRRKQEVIYLDDSDDSVEPVPRKRHRPSISAVSKRRSASSSSKRKA